MCMPHAPASSLACIYHRVHAPFALNDGMIRHDELTDELLGATTLAWRPATITKLRPEMTRCRRRPRLMSLNNKAGRAPPRHLIIVWACRQEGEQHAAVHQALPLPSKLSQLLPARSSQLACSQRHRLARRPPPPPPSMLHAPQWLLERAPSLTSLHIAGKLWANQTKALMSARTAKLKKSLYIQ